MDRRSFLAATAGTAATLPLATKAAAQDQPQIRWRLTSSFPRSLDAIFGAAEVLARSLAEATDNRFQLQLFAAGEMVPGLQALDAVSAGSVECAHTPIYIYIGKEPTLAFGTGIPFGLNTRQQAAWLAFGGGGEIVDEALARFNVIGMLAGGSGCQMGGWFRKEINSIEDLKGLKFRIAGMGGQVLAHVGVIPQQIAAGDVYPALERGTIDAAEFVGPYDDEKLGFARVAKNYYYPGWWEGGAMMHLVVNRDRWNALPPSYKAALRGAAAEAHNYMIAKYDAANAAALKRLIQAGISVRPFPIPVMDACYQAADAHYAAIAAQNPLFKRALESLKAFRADQLFWWQASEHFYDTYMISKRA